MSEDQTRTLSDAEVATLREQVARDRQRAQEVREHARTALSQGKIELVPDITGAPGVHKAFNEAQRQKLRGMQEIGEEPFFAKVETTVTGRSGRSEPACILFTRANGAPGWITTDDWVVVPWTHPLSSEIRGKPVGERVQIASGSTHVKYDIDVSAEFQGEILPTVTDALYTLASGVVHIADEGQLAAAEAPVFEEAPAAKAHEAATAIGLNDIIVLADRDQRSIMLLPFADNVLIEGPPGCGKTSIGLMRIACLRDQQWMEAGLNLKVGRDAAFHEQETMRVLVFNEEMVDYLKTLTQSIRADRVPVQTTKKFLQQVCRATSTITGREAPDKPSVAMLKGRREVLSAYWRGFQQHLSMTWATSEKGLRKALLEIGPDFVTLIDDLQEWVKRVETAEMVDATTTVPVSVAESLTKAASRISDGLSPTRVVSTVKGDARSRMPPEKLAEGLRSARELVGNFLKEALDRVMITRQMFTTAEFSAVLDAARRAGLSDKRIGSGQATWQKLVAGAAPTYSEYDLAMAAWLGTRVMLVSAGSGKPWIGAARERITHMVLDEVQDLSPSHIATLRAMVTPKGTITMVGDLRQNLNPSGGIKRWEDVETPDLKRAAFTVVYRQTQEIGLFIHFLQSKLFQDRPSWEPSFLLTGARPRAGKVRSWKHVGKAVASEARHWREATPGATVAVLYDGRVQPQRLRALRDEIEASLQDQITSVHLIEPRSRGGQLRETDCIVIASVKQTKGLEFDAVVFVDIRLDWSRDAREIDPKLKNGLYVAASRARGGLSFCMRSLPKCFNSGVTKRLLQVVKWSYP